MLTPIYSPGEQRQRALKALRLNGNISPDYSPHLARLLAASSTKKLTIGIKRLLSLVIVSDIQRPSKANRITTRL